MATDARGDIEAFQAFRTPHCIHIEASTGTAYHIISRRVDQGRRRTPTICRLQAQTVRTYASQKSVTMQSCRRAASVPGGH